ncbi:hypothetical protein ABPG77_006077 [Micractinium sp. CCAP 211/92]
MTDTSSDGGGGQQAAAAAPAPQKARLRGVIHNYAAFVALGVGIMLCLEAQTLRARLGCLIYTISTTTMFGVSASYHRPTWAPAQRALWRRLDHAAIFLLIAGTNTPLALIALEPAQSTRLLSLVWSGATAGILQCLFFAHAPKALAAVLYVALGWMALPFVDDFTAVLPSLDVGLIVTGGVIYSLGALIYALKRPNPVPHVFGYHELFHTFVTLAALLHFAAVQRVVNSPLGAPK